MTSSESSTPQANVHTASPTNDASIKVSAPGGALGELRRAIDQYTDWHEVNADNDTAVESALAAVEARIAAYERFVKAWDAVEWSLADPWKRGSMVADDELRGARAALTAKGAAP